MTLRIKFLRFAAPAIACLIAGAPILAQSDGATDSTVALVVSDFMADLPPSTFEGGISEIFKSRFYSRSRGLVLDSRFYDKKKVAGVKVVEIVARAERGFVAECEAKGGHIEPQSNTATYIESKREIGLKGWWDNGPTSICIGPSGDAMGMFAAWRPTRDGHGSIVVALAPQGIVTDKVREARAAERETARQLRLAEERIENARVENWRRGIATGTETNCGPVLQVKGDLIEVIYRYNREPRWYRSSELKPERDAEGSFYSC